MKKKKTENNTLVRCRHFRFVSVSASSDLFDRWAVNLAPACHLNNSFSFYLFHIVFLLLYIYVLKPFFTAWQCELTQNNIVFLCCTFRTNDRWKINHRKCFIFFSPHLAHFLKKKTFVLRSWTSEDGSGRWFRWVTLRLTQNRWF